MLRNNEESKITMDKLTDIEQDILIHIQKYTSSGRKITLNILAEELHVAPSTVVKLAKKIGYTGFTDMNYQMRSTAQKQTAFEKGLIEGNLDEVIGELANLLIQHENDKNLVIIPGESDYLEKYISRKLQMFDIFAPDTYDYSMVDNPRLEKGIAFIVSDSYELGDYEIVRQAKQQGYYFVVLAKDRFHMSLNYADMKIIFQKTEYKSADFFGAKVIVLIEKMLSEFAKRKIMIDKMKMEEWLRERD